ncbi:MAG: GAF domain-containing protein [Betaproteobacteria bacterium]|nr:GAF domain-containing protein [Betaproteobacteria bacterium]
MAGATKAELAEQLRALQKTLAREKAKSKRLERKRAEALEQRIATAEILRVIAGSPSDAQPVLDAIAASAMKLVGGFSAALARVEGDKILLDALTTTGKEGDEALRGLFPQSLSAGTGVVARTIRSRAPCCIADTETDPGFAAKFRKMARERGFRSTLAVPMWRSGEVTGCISVTRREPGRFPDEQIELLKTFADQAVIAIENARLFKELETRNGELAETLEKQTATSEILRAISQSLTDVKPVFEAIAESAMRLLKAWSAAVFSFDGDMLHLGAARGSLPDTEEYLRSRYPRRPGPGSLSSRAIEARAPFQVGDAQADPDPSIREIARQRGYRAGLSVPLLRNGEPIGTIAVSRVEAGVFSNSEVELLQTFAAQAVIAIENVRLFNETREALERQTATAEILKVIASSPTDVQPVFDAIVRSAMALIGGFSAQVTRVFEDKLHLAAFTTTSESGDAALKDLYPIPLTSDHLSAQAIRARSPIVISDTESDPQMPPKSQEVARARGFRRIMYVPMIREGVAIGTIHVTHREPGLFSVHQIELLKTFADQAVIAIENVRLFNETKEGFEQQTAISEILRVISSSPADVQPVLVAVAERAARICAAQIADIVLAEGGTMRVAASIGDLGRPGGSEPVPLDRTSVMGRAIVDKAVVHVADLQNAPESEFPLGRTLARNYGHRTILAVPLLREDRALGTILLRRAEVRSFDDKHIALLKTFADQAAIAIENVRLFNETKEALERQTATAEILKVIASSPSDVQPVFDSIAESAMRLFAGHSAAVTRVVGDTLHLAGFTTSSEAGNEALKSLFPMPRSSTTIFNTVVRSGKPAYRSDTENDPDLPPELQEFARARGFRSALAVPMLREGVVIGTINVTRAEPGRFTDHQINLLKTFADQAVIAIENVRLFNETKEALEQQTATAEILRVISGSPTDVQPVLDAVAASAARLCEATDTLIQLRQGDGLRLAAHYGQIPTRSTSVIIPITRGWASGRAIMEGRSFHTHDIQAEKDEFPVGSEIARKMGYRTALATPLMREGTAIGVINVRRTAVRPFSDKQIALVQTFADQAVIAIENVRLFNETKEALDRQTATNEILRAMSGSMTDIRPVFDAILQNAIRLCEGDAARLFQYDGQVLRIAAGNNTTLEGDTYLREKPLPLGTYNPTPQAGLERRVVHVLDVFAEPSYRPLVPSGTTTCRPDAPSVLAVPLLRDGNLLGVITIWRYEKRLFTDKQVEMVKTFAAQAAIAIENVRLFNETKEALERQTATAEVLKAISRTTFDLDSVLQTLMDNATQLCGATHGVMVRPDADGNYVPSVAHGYDKDHPLLEVMRRNPVTPGRASGSGRVLLEKRTVHIPDVRSDPEYARKDGLDAGGHRSLLCVPMLRDGEPIGVITMSRGEKFEPFTDKQIELVTTFADQAVIAIENVRLFNETKQALERQTATAEILRVISSSPTDVQPVFDAIAEIALKLCDAGFSAITRFDGELIHLAALTNVLPEAAVAIQNAWPQPPGPGSATTRAVLERTTIHIPDIREYPEYALRGAAETADFRSVLAVPMLRDGIPLGAITVLRSQPNPFPEQQIALLRTFAAQAVIAIENVRLFNETKEGLERQTATNEILRAISGSMTDIRPVFDAILENAIRLCEGDAARLFQYDGQVLRIAAGNNTTLEGDSYLRDNPLPLGTYNPTPQAGLEHRIVHVLDVFAEPGYRPLVPSGTTNYRPNAPSVLAVPLLREGDLLGVITIWRYEKRVFTDKQVEMVNTFAAQAAIAIENARLFNETKEALERQTATAEILKVIASSPSDVQPVFDAIAQAAARLVGGFAASVTRVVGDKLHLAALTPTSESGDEILRGTFPRPIGDDGVFGNAIASGAPAFRTDIETDREISPQFLEIARARGYRSVIAVPMIRDGEAIGAISVIRRDPGAFSSHQTGLLQTFADQAVIAIENVRLFNETKEGLERQTATAEILKAIATSPSDVQPVLDAVAASAARLCEASDAIILLRNGDDLVYAAHHGPIPTRPAGATYPISPGFVIGRAVLEGKQFHIPDLQAETERFPEGSANARKLGYRGNLTTPLLREGSAIGVILVRRTEARPFTENQIALMRTFADQAVIAIENVRLFNETKEALERQTATAEILKVISSSFTDTQPVFDAIVKSALRIFNGQGVGLLLADGDRLLLGSAGGTIDMESARKRFPQPLNRGSASGQAILDRVVVNLADCQAPEMPEIARELGRALEYRAIAAAPLLREGIAAGALVVTRKEPGALAEKDIGLLRTFADQAVIAIENVRLFNETKEALERQTATSEILRVISSSPTDLQPVFDAILENAMRLCESHLGFLGLYDGERYVHVAQRGGSGEYAKWLARGPFVPHPGQAIGRMLRDRKPVHHQDLRESAGYREGVESVVKTVDVAGARTLLAVPMLKEGRVVGGIVIYRPEERPFTQKQIELVSTFADQAVIAIQNVRLFNETKEALERQTATADILKVISSSPTDEQPVFDAIVESAERLFTGRRAVLRIVEGEKLILRALSSGGTSNEYADRFRVLPVDRDSSVGQAVLDCKVLEVIDTKASGASAFASRNADRLGFRSISAAPLLREGKGIGVIAVTSTEPGGLSEKQRQLLQTFADQAVIAIENVRLFKELQARTEALTRSVGQLTALGAVGQAISSTLDLETVLKTIVSHAVELTGMDGGSIYEYDERSEEFHLAAAENVPQEIADDIRRAPIRKGEGALGRSAVTLEPTQIPDTLDADYHSGRRELLIRAGYRALLAVPLLREDHLLGGLLVNRKTPGPFAPEVVELLKTFATQSAMAIQNARLFREIAEKGKQLEVASRHKSDFLSSMSHELRTPLNAILGFNEMILGEIYGDVPADMKEPLTDIQTSGKHLLRLINNVLDLAKIEAGRMELAPSEYVVNDIVETVRSSLRPLAADKGLEFVAVVAEDIPLAYGDAGRITQCLMNLAGNSLKFTKAGKVEIAVEIRGELLAYRVSDTGIGMAPDKIGNLFSEFRQADATIAGEYGGTGLGLSISKKFVELHGGRIWVESELGKGSAFLFEIPLRFEAGGTP